jgi:hypothetical protein
MIENKAQELNGKVRQNSELGDIIRMVNSRNLLQDGYVARMVETNHIEFF